MSLQIVLHLDPTRPATLHNQSIRFYEWPVDGNGSRRLRARGAEYQTLLELHTDSLQPILIAFSNAYWNGYANLPSGLRRYHSIRRVEKLVWHLFRQDRKIEGASSDWDNLTNSWVDPLAVDFPILVETYGWTVDIRFIGNGFTKTHDLSESTPFKILF